MPPFKADNYLDLSKKIHDARVRRIKMKYTDDLNRVIRMMLNPVACERPSVEDLLTIPHVETRVREEKLKYLASKLD